MESVKQQNTKINYSIQAHVKEKVGKTAEDMAWDLNREHGAISDGMMMTFKRRQEKGIDIFVYKHVAVFTTMLCRPRFKAARTFTNE